MTQVIRLNDAIIDYSSRPVITLLGEPILALHPDTYKNKFNSGSVLSVSNVIVDGSIYNTAPVPFSQKVGTGGIVFNSTVDGNFISTNNCGILSNLTNPLYRWSSSVLVATKFRINSLNDLDTANEASRLLTVGRTSIFNIEIKLDASLVPSINITLPNAAGAYETYTEQLVLGKIYSLIAYRTLNGATVILNGKVVFSSTKVFGTFATDSNNNIQDIFIGGSFYYPAWAKTNADWFGFELYGNVEVTDSQLLTYAKSL